MFENLFEYKAWSDQRLQSVIKSTVDEKSNVESKSIYSFVNQQLNHMVIVEELFRARILKETSPHSVTNTTILPTIDSLFLRLFASNKWFSHLVAITSNKALTEKIYFVFVDNQKGCMSLQEIFFHVIQHGVYHRSAIGHALQTAGFVRPADTYSLFLHDSEPERRKSIQ